MSNQIKGTVIKIPHMQTGTGKNGEWVKQEFVIETDGQYPKKVCLSAWGALANFASLLQFGQKVVVSYNLESKEHNERWYNEIKAYKIEKVDSEDNKTTEEPLSNKSNLAENSDDLPF